MRAAFAHDALVCHGRLCCSFCYLNTCNCPTCCECVSDACVCLCVSRCSALLRLAARRQAGCCCCCCLCHSGSCGVGYTSHVHHRYSRSSHIIGIHTRMHTRTHTHTLTHSHTHVHKNLRTNAHTHSLSHFRSCTKMYMTPHTNTRTFWRTQICTIATLWLLTWRAGGRVRAT